MSTSPALERIWDDFRRERKAENLPGMKAALAAFDAEYDPATLPRYAPQKQMARRGAMVRAIEKQAAKPTYDSADAGTW